MPLRAAKAAIMILRSILGGIRMCHEWWLRRWSEEREASRRIWDESDRTRPLADPEVRDEQPEVTLEKQETEQVAAER